MKNKYHGWAFDTNEKEGRGLIGRFWRFGDSPPNIPRSLLAHRTALFETRKEARENLKHVRRSFPKAKVVRAFVTITTK